MKHDLVISAVSFCSSCGNSAFMEEFYCAPCYDRQATFIYNGKRDLGFCHRTIKKLEAKVRLLEKENFELKQGKLL